MTEVKATHARGRYEWVRPDQMLWDGRRTVNADVLPAPLARLSQDHVNVRAILSTVEREVDAIAQYRTASSTLVDNLRRLADLLTHTHHPAEHLIASALEHRAQPATADDVPAVAESHQIIAALDQTRRLADKVAHDPDTWRASFCEAARRLIVMKRDRIHRQEAGLFAMARAHLKAADWQQIDAEIYAASSV